MGKINGCLKCLFIFFNVLFAIFGALMIFGLIKSSGYSHQLSAVGSVAWAWVFALAVLGTSCLGIFAGHSEKPILLKIFAGFMGVGIIAMMIYGIIVAIGRNEAKNAFQKPEVVEAFIEESNTLNALQREFGCCGVTSASDWGDEIPSSCACGSAYGYSSYARSASGCKARPQGTSGPDQIYKQPCSDILFKAMNGVFSIILGICFGFAAVALLGLLISLLMIHQIKRHDNPGTSFAM